MAKTPIALIIDDPAPRVFVYHEHAGKETVQDGRPIPDNVPNSFLFRFCDVVEKYGIRGKFSVVPMAGGRGRIDEGFSGFPYSEIQEWVDTVKTRLSPYFSFCPEILTHHGYIDLSTMQMQGERENEWSFRQTSKELTPYIAFGLQLLKNVGIDATGVTSPWDFGEKNEDEYAKAIAYAMDEVWGRKESWYFCRSVYRSNSEAKPWMGYEDATHKCVAIPGTISDNIWQSMDTNDTSEEYISKIADNYLTADGKSGKILEVLKGGGWPILTTQWQSLFSNGNETGIRILGTVAQRVQEHLSDQVQWMCHEELMREAMKTL